MRKFMLVAMATLLISAASAQTTSAPAPKKDSAAAAADTAAAQPLYLVGDLQAFDRLYRAVKASAAPYIEVELLINWIESQLKAQLQAREKSGAAPPKK